MYLYIYILQLKLVVGCEIINLLTIFSVVTSSAKWSSFKRNIIPRPRALAAD